MVLSGVEAAIAWAGVPETQGTPCAHSSDPRVIGSTPPGSGVGTLPGSVALYEMIFIN